jgi:hypothetical protein
MEVNGRIPRGRRLAITGYDVKRLSPLQCLQNALGKKTDAGARNKPIRIRDGFSFFKTRHPRTNDEQQNKG